MDDTYSWKLLLFSQGLIEESETLKMESEDFKRKYNYATSKALRLEGDIVSVTNKAIEKETELDRYL